MVCPKLAAAVMIVLLSSTAAAASSCRGVVQPVVSVQVSDQKVDYRHYKSIREINRLPGKSPNVLMQGLTAFRWEVGFSAGVEGVPMRDGTYCLRVTKPVATIVVDGHIVWLPKEFPAGSCEYRAVRRHEDKHVAVNRRILAKLRKALRGRLQEEMRKLQTARSVSGNRFYGRARQLHTELNNVVTLTQNSLSRAMDAAQARVDTDVEYRRVKRSCGPGSLLQRDF